MPPFFGYNDSYGRITGRYTAFYPSGGSGFGDSGGADRLMGRWQKGWDAMYKGWFNEADRQTAFDPFTVRRNAEGIQRDTSMFKRMFGLQQDRLDGILSPNMDSAKIASTIGNAYEQGDPDPLDRLTNIYASIIGVASLKNTKHLSRIAEAAVDVQDARVGALSAQKACDGWDLTGCDDSVLDTLILKSRDSMTPEEYNMFIRKMDMEIERMTGKSLSTFIRDKHAQIVHIPFLNINLGGTTAKGKEYINAIDSANNAHESVNYAAYGGRPFMSRASYG